MDEGLVSSQVAVASDPTDHQTDFLPRAGEDVFGEFGVRFG